MKKIPMNIEMTKAILDGRKTQFRRVAKNIDNSKSVEYIRDCVCKRDFKLPYCIGETIFVKESFVIEGRRFNNDGTITHHEEPIVHYRADEKELTWYDEWEDEVNVPWKSPMHMNKEIARIFLRITNVRVERLQDITSWDKLKEGYKKHENGMWKADEVYEWFNCLWNKTAKQGYRWEDNPYVFVYEFEIVNHDT